MSEANSTNEPGQNPGQNLEQTIDLHEESRIIRERYESGLANVTDVLRAAEAALDAESRTTTAEMDVILQTVALERALGRL